MEFDFDVVSSSGEGNYKVVVLVEDTRQVVVRCTCPAGVFGKLCKHKVMILTEILNPTSIDVVNSKLSEANSLLADTNIFLFIRELNIAESKLNEAKKLVLTAKGNLEKILNGKGQKP
jgi:uncharacterized Zn finger protein